MSQKYLDAVEFLKTKNQAAFIDAVQKKRLDVELAYTSSDTCAEPDPTLFDQVCKYPDLGDCILALLPFVSEINAEQLARVYGKASDVVSEKFLARFIEVNGGQFPATGAIFHGEYDREKWKKVNIWKALRHYHWSFKLARLCIEIYGMPVNMVVECRKRFTMQMRVIALEGVDSNSSNVSIQLSEWLLSKYTHEQLGITGDAAVDALKELAICDVLAACMDPEYASDKEVPGVHSVRMERAFWHLVEAAKGEKELQKALNDILNTVARNLKDRNGKPDPDRKGALLVSRMVILAGADIYSLCEEKRTLLPAGLVKLAHSLQTETPCDKCCGKGTLARFDSEYSAPAKRARIVELESKLQTK